MITRLVHKCIQKEMISKQRPSLTHGPWRAWTVRFSASYDQPLLSLLEEVKFWTKIINSVINNKKAQLSLTNPRDAKVCQQLLQFDVFTTLSLTILAYLHSFTCCCVRNLRNSLKIQTYGVQGHPRSSILFLVSTESPYVTSY